MDHHRSALNRGLLKFTSQMTAAMLVLFALQPLAAQVSVSPAELRFNDPFARQQLLVTQTGRDATSVVTYSSSDPSVVSVDERGFVTPLKAGSATIQIKADGDTLTVPVDVPVWDAEQHIDFATEIAPLLSRYGCNSGGCHGKASGQNGFKLSLFAFDTAYDYDTLVKEARGRRIFPAAPDRSLLLEKATGVMPHGGGKRFNVDSEPYQLMRAWIVAGARPPRPDAPRVDSLRVEPAAASLREGDLQQLRVIAVYTDGSERDVTRRAEYSSNLDVVATVDARGLVTASEQSGEATMMVRYMGNVGVFRAIRPHGEPLNELADFSPITEIDRLAAEHWKQLGLRPSPATDDTTFLRRLTIDLCGRLPTVAETREFLADTSSNKRLALIDRLLDSPDYPAYFAMKWSVILRNSRLAGADQAAYAFHNWIRDMIARNRPYDEFVRGIVVASGEWQDSPAINWYWQSRDDQLHTVTADTAQLFLGLRLQCARCHHHPYERWGQEDYFGLAGFFTRLGRKSFGQPPPYFSSSKPTTSEQNPLTGKVPEPKFLGGEYATLTPEQDPRHALVDWMAEPENPFFARTMVNRLWAQFFGRGLVHEVDDMRDTNPPSNPEILDYLAAEFVKSKFDTKHIIRLLVTSRVYQLSSEPRPENEADTQNFARFYARRMIAEVLHDAVDQTCGTRTRFGNISDNARAIDLPHEGFGSYFLDTFDRPQRISVCECERSAGASLAQVLLLANSDEMENKLASNEGRVANLVQEGKSAAEIVDELYIAALSRPPHDEEQQIATAHIEAAPPDGKRRAVEDLLWTLVNTREFMFNH